MKRLFVAVILLSLSMPMAAVRAESKPLPPPPSDAFGKPLADWMLLYWNWIYGQNQPDHVGRVIFLPIPEATEEEPGRWVGERNVTLPVGTPFVLPFIGWLGERYTPASNTPDDPLLSDTSIFTKHSNIVVTLDDKTVIDYRKDNLNKYYYAKYFDSPISYTEPQQRDLEGKVFADAAIYAQGLGFVHPPLSVGTHTLTLHSELHIVPYGLHVQYDNRWNITVKP